MKVLGVNVLCVFCDSADRLVRRVIGAGEVAHVNEQTEVRVCNSRDELFDPVTVLRKIAVVLDHCRYAFLCGVFGHFAAALDERGQSLIEAAVCALRRVEAACRVVAHTRRAEYLSYIDLSEQALALLVERAVEKLRADGVVDYRQIFLFALVAQTLGVFFN